MKFRTTLMLLLLVIAALCILFFHTARQQSDRKHREQQMRVFTARELLGTALDPGKAFRDKVKRITIQGTEQDVALARALDASREAWHLEEPIQALADPAQVMAIIQAIELMQAKVILTDEPGSPLRLEAYGLVEPSRKILFETERSSWTLHVGDATADSQNAYVTRPGSDEPRVYVVPLEYVAPFFLKGSELRDNAAIRFNKTGAYRIAIHQADAPEIECQKSDGEWALTRPISDIANPAAILYLINTITSLRIAPEDFIAETDFQTLPLGLDAPSLTLTVADETGERTLALGTGVPDREAMVSAKRSGDGAVFALHSDSLAALPLTIQDMRCKVVLPINPDAVMRMTISGDEEVRLERTEETWNMIRPAGHTTDSFLVRAFLEDLTRLPVTEWIDEPGPQQLKDAGLETPRITLKLSIGENHSDRMLLLGSLTSDGDLCSARRGQSGPVLLIPGRIPDVLEDGALAFLSKTAFEFNRSSASAIRITHGDSEVMIERREDGWLVTRPGHRSADTSTVNELLWALCYVQALELLPADPTKDAKYGLGNPRVSATVFLGAEPAETRTLTIGKDCGDGSCYATVVGTQYIFSISESVSQTLIKNLDKLLNRTEVEAK